MSSIRRTISSRANGALSKLQSHRRVELGLVEEMFSAFWRQRRAWAIETRILDDAIATQPPDEDELARLANGFNSVAAQPPLELVHRYETRLHRIFQRALANLILMRSLPELTPPENVEIPNDPIPISGQSDAPEPEAGEMRPKPPAQPAPLAEDIKLPNDPSPISEQSTAPEPEARHTGRAPNPPPKRVERISSIRFPCGPAEPKNSGRLTGLRRESKLKSGMRRSAPVHGCFFPGN